MKGSKPLSFLPAHMTESKRKLDEIEKKQPHEARKIPTDDLDKLEQQIIKSEGLKKYKALNAKI